jgi:hypothetical protein
MRFLDRGAWANNPTITPASGGGFFSERQLREMTVDAMKAYIRRRIGGYAVAIKDVRPSANRLYRGRICLERPRNVSAISYPNPEVVKKCGRANRAGRSMFYCSLGDFPVLLELRVKKGDLVAVSEWALIEPLWMHFLGYHPEALATMNAPVPVQRTQLLNPIPNETPRNERLRSQMSVAFTRDVPDGKEYRYKETIAISELLFDRASPIRAPGPDAPQRNRAAGIVYPSIQMRGLADNIAVLPEFVDSCLQIRSVRYLRVEAADHNALSYAFLSSAVSNNFSETDIVWSDEAEPEALCRVDFSDGGWTFRNDLGE